MDIQSITNIFPFQNRLRFFSLPDVRLIGKSLRHTNETSVTPIPLFWEEYFKKYHKTVEGLPQVVPTTVAWFSDYDSITKAYTYMVCSICPAGTPVPSGFEYRDVPSMLLGHGTTSDFPPPAHNIGRFAKEVESHGFVQGHVCCEFYPYDVKNSDVCCTLFTIYPKDINIRIAKKGR